MKPSDSTSNRQAPAIRDHDTIRQIGRGAFGEVWLARSVTGALRAVKVIWREDYDHEESFEREFEALKHFEPISRRHPGLLPILQVGRNLDEGFYYYVMELADDLKRGREIDPDTYQPHTLTLQMRNDKRIPISECFILGAQIAEGLDYLHRKDLIHRDVKPSNLIYVDGMWRLADIGLVALLGQRSFVGTEGFVAPEGPGTAASDIFSLGMVLYEAGTGKDRLDFPDLPSTSGTGENLELWRRLNRIICKACATRARDRYTTAGEMAKDLRGEPLAHKHRPFYWAAAAFGVLSLAVGFGMWLNRQKDERGVISVEIRPPTVTIQSTPPGATVFMGETRLGVTPLQTTPSTDVPTLYQLRMEGFKRVEVEHIPSPDRHDSIYQLKLESSRLPQPGERWTNTLGMEFKPRGRFHSGLMPVEMSFFSKFLEDQKRPFEGRVVRFAQTRQQQPIYIAVVPITDAEAFRFWLTDRDRAAGFLSQEHYYEIEPFYFIDDSRPPDEITDVRTGEVDVTSELDWQAFYLRLNRQSYGSISIKTFPPGVQVYQNDVLIGETPLELPRVRVGIVEYDLRAEGFTDLVLDGEVREAHILELFGDMEARQGVTFGRTWTNSLGMPFVPLGEILMAVWETRRRDYNEFVKQAGSRQPTKGEQSDPRSGTQPVTQISRDEARAFCAWLTEHERATGLISPSDTYRLPTDEEWSRAAGLPLERGTDPAQRSGRIRGIFPWGFEWPPPSDHDNLADASAVQRAGAASAIPDYDDSFSFSAPVNSLQPNARGLVGLGGNVSEWVDTDFELNPNITTESDTGVIGTVRGGNWLSYQQETLLASIRHPFPADTKKNTIGFRIVLSRQPSDEEEDRP